MAAHSQKGLDFPQNNIPIIFTIKDTVLTMAEYIEIFPTS